MKTLAYIRHSLRSLDRDRPNNYRKLATLSKTSGELRNVFKVLTTVYMGMRV